MTAAAAIDTVGAGSPFELHDRVALVTGAGRGLGAACAEALARAGARVVLSDIDETALEAQARKFALNGWQHELAHLDVTNAEHRGQVVRRLDEIGRLDILVNNAGIILRKPAIETTSEELLHVLEVDLISMFSLSRDVLPLMERNRYGRIVNMSSIMGHIGRAGQSTYVMAKHGVVGLTKSFAAEFGPAGVTCNAVGPGYILTEMNQSIMTPPFVESVTRRTPLRRWGTPEDVAGVVVFLSSPASAFVTGQLILIDGGLTVTVPGPAQC